MNKRHMVSRPATMGVRTGTLRDVLKEHAQERCEHYFKYLFSMKSLVDRLNASHNLGWKYLDCVDLNATDQFGDGDRSTDADVYKFFTLKKREGDILDCYSTDWARVDAAHFNNLGISPTKRTKLAELATEARDPIAHSLFEQLKLSCAGTRMLPASVNTGADKIVDNVHKRSVQKMMGDKAPVTRANVDVYVNDAKSSLTRSLDAKRRKGHVGVVAVRERYIAFYDNAADVTEAFRKAQDTVFTECGAFGMDPAKYTSSMVA